MLFSQPVTRGEILIGKFLGLFASIFTATVIGFALPSVIIAAKEGAEVSMRYPLGSITLGFKKMSRRDLVFLRAWLLTLERREQFRVVTRNTLNLR